MFIEGQFFSVGCQREKSPSRLCWSQFLKKVTQLESRMRENRLSGSEGSARSIPRSAPLPTPICCSNVILRTLNQQESFESGQPTFTFSYAFYEIGTF
jgi:hypothetical protein